MLGEGRAGQRRIGYVGAAMHSILPDVLAEIRKTLPLVHASLFELRSLDQILELKTGKLDIGFIRLPTKVPGLCLEPVYSEPLSVVLPSSHPLARRKKFRLSDLADEPFISFGRECAPGLFDSIIGLCNREGFSPRIVHQSSQVNSVIRLVESGLGYSIVPASVRNGYKLRVRFRDLDRFPERAQLALAYFPEHLTPAAEIVIARVLNLGRKRGFASRLTS